MAALVGPLLVDWTAYRTQFEQQATAILGHPVRVSGTADATLLPYPSLTFTEVVIGSDPAQPVMTVGRFDVEVELFPLMEGRFQVTDMRLADPVVTVRVAEDGRFEWLASGSDAPIDPNAVSLDRVSIVGGVLRILDARRPEPVTVRDIAARLEARSLLGPFKLDGSARVEGEPVTVRLSTGSADGSGRMVVKMGIDPAERPVSIALDGQVDTAGDRVTFLGKTEVRRVVPENATDVLPWLLTAESEFDASQLLLKQLEFRYGPEDRPFSITGAATVNLGGEPNFTAVLSARQLDLDRTLGQGPDQPVAFQAVLAALSRAIVTLPTPPIPGQIGFDIPGVVVGGSLMTDLTLDLATAADGWHVETLQAGLPGETTLAATGEILVRPAPSFEGNVALQSDQPATLIAWWRPDLPRTRLQPFDARASMALSPTGLSLTDIDTVIGEARISGEASYLPSGSGRAARLSLQLGATELDIEQAEAVAALFGDAQGQPTSTDVVVQLKAGALKAGDSMAEGLDVSASLVDGTLSVDRFAVRNLAGARLSAAGTIRDLGTAPDGSFQGQISAERLDGLASLARAVAPQSRFADLLTTAAPVLVPANVQVTVSARAAEGSTDASIAVAGTAGGSTIDSRLAFRGRVDAWRDATTELALAVEGPNGVRLMRQLGIDVPDVASAGAGSLTVTASGVPATGVSGQVEGSLGQTGFRLAGSGRVDATGNPKADLDVALRSPDAGPILALSGSMMADLMASMPVDLQAKVAVDGDRAAVDDLSGTVDDEPLAGALQLDFSGVVPKASGRLALRSATLEGLAELSLGSGTLAFPIVGGGSPWPEAPFGPATLDAIETDLALSLERVDLTETLAATGVTLSLRSSASGVGYDDISAAVAGGRLTGAILVKQDLEGTAAVSGSLTLSEASVAEFAWRRNDRPVLTGLLNLGVEGSATGRTVAGLMSTLTGGGSFRIADGVIHSFNPQAFVAVIRAADGGTDLSDERIAEVFADNVDAGDLAFQSVEGTYTLAGGVLRAPNIVVAGASSDTTGSATIDLARQTLESDWRIAFDPRDAAAAEGAPPQVGILFRGDLDDPDRTIDVTAFSSWLGIRAFERETERVLRMQADILERELLSRQVLRGREELERARRAAEEAERRRVEEEARRAAEEEARRLAEEEAARRALEAPPPPAPEPLPADPAPIDGSGPTAEPGAAETGSADDFAEEILRQLRANEPGADNGLPGVQSPPPGAVN